MITWVAGHVGLSHPLSPAKGSVALRGLWHGVQPRGPDLRAAEGRWTVGFETLREFTYETMVHFP